jgi:GAF domain-containing protein
LYSADAAGNLHLEHRTLAEAPPLVHSNDELAVKLRESARRVDLSRLHKRMAGDWAFPMVVSGNVIGALVLGARTEGVSYRPEELNQLADSARTIGLHLESLRAAELQRQHSELTQRLNELADTNRSLAAEIAVLKGPAA